MKNTTKSVRLTEKHSGKMAGMVSISTPCTVNPRCLQRMADGNSICAQCYADALLSARHTLEEKLLTNAAILAKRLLTADEIAALNINAAFFRFEAFGDIINARHALNYRNIADAIPSTRCALWSKNYDIIAPVMAQYGKPANLRLIRSIEKVNPTEAEVMTALNEYECIDAVFAVYTKDYAESHGVEINCGARHCLSCHLCYDGDARVIREILKPTRRKKSR